jgi:cation diffusion facilitator CzcD-associated flavoprotein CzcO
VSEIERLDVLIVGAGLSGIGAAHHIQCGAPWASYAVLEAREAIGGTWDLFRYPGIRSDSDMFTMGYPFRPWAGEKAIADGDSIRRYIADTARDDGADTRIRFRHRVTSAGWSSAVGRWTVTALRTNTDETVRFECRFLFCCTGYYRYDRGHVPDFPGMDSFEGPVIHPQRWPDDLDYTGKKVVVIGSGATAVTLVPAIAGRAGHVTMLQRSPTYIASVPGGNPLSRLRRDGPPGRRSSTAIRWIVAAAGQGMYQLSRRRPERVKAMLLRRVARALPAGYDVGTHFTPSYQPWDQRMCLVPDGDLFRAISGGQASVVTDHIGRFTKHGIQLQSGAELAADIVISATGLELLFLGGIDLTVDGEPVDVAKRVVYKGMMLDGVPNLAFAFGYTNASWTLKSDLICQYVVRLLTRMRSAATWQAVPVFKGGPNSRVPMIGLTSGYVQRAIDHFPKQAPRGPWKVHQNYLLDYRLLKRGSIDDAMRFSAPTLTISPPASEPPPMSARAALTDSGPGPVEVPSGFRH